MRELPQRNEGILTEDFKERFEVRIFVIGQEVATFEGKTVWQRL